LLQLHLGYHIWLSRLDPLHYHSIEHLPNLHRRAEDQIVERLQLDCVSALVLVLQHHRVWIAFLMIAFLMIAFLMIALIVLMIAFLMIAFLYLIALKCAILPLYHLL